MCRVIHEILCEVRIEACIDDVCDDQKLASRLHYVTGSESVRLEIYAAAKHSGGPSHFVVSEDPD